MNHIALTIEELDSRIDLLTGIRDNLKLLFPMDGNDRAAELPGPTRLTPPRNSSKAVNKPAKRRKSGGIEEVDDGSIAAVLNLEEPFDAQAVADIVGRERHLVAGKLFRWMRKGWLKKAGRGRFARSKDFPNGDITASLPLVRRGRKAKAQTSETPDASLKVRTPLATARIIPEPFTVASLAANSGFDENICQVAINRWTGWGWIKSAGDGEWERTKLFGNQQ